MKNEHTDQYPIERLTTWIGSVPSLVLHSIIFFAFLTLSVSGIFSWDLMLLILTTIVSLEAIYLAIFIQMTVNRHTKSLREVEADVNEIQENIDEIQEDVEEMSEDLEEITEDERVEEHKKSQDAATLETLTNDIRRVLADLEQLKKTK